MALVVSIPRVCCSDCGAVKQIALPFADPKKHFTRALEHLHEADLVLDHFHLVKWFNDKLATLRRQLYREASQMNKDILKGSR